MYPTPWIEYLIYFHTQRDYFECHEVLEEYWKERNKSEMIWVGFIQLAVGLYHQRRKNEKGAYKMLSNAYSILLDQENELKRLGIDSSALYPLLEQKLSELKDHQPYQSINLPLKDTLLQACEQYCLEHEIAWEILNERPEEYIIHKHKLRDRSDVIHERERSLVEKRQQN